MEVRSFFRPEFYNRIDRVVTFQPLGLETCLTITRQALEEIARREGLAKRRLRLRYTDRLVERLTGEGFDRRYGARPLQRTLEDRVVARISHLLVEQPALCNRDLRLDANSAGEVLVSDG